MLVVCEDHEEVYDRVDREMPWQVLETYGLSETVGKTVRSVHER